MKTIKKGGVKNGPRSLLRIKFILLFVNFVVNLIGLRFKRTNHEIVNKILMQIFSLLFQASNILN